MRTGRNAIQTFVRQYRNSRTSPHLADSERNPKPALRPLLRRLLYYYTTTVTTTFLLWLRRKKKKGLSTHNLVFLTTWRNENPSGGRLLAAPRHDSNSCGFSFRFYQFSFADIPIIIITKKGEKKRIILISFHVKRKWRRWKRTCRSVLNKKNVWLFVLFYKYFGLHTVWHFFDYNLMDVLPLSGAVKCADLLQTKMYRRN